MTFKTSFPATHSYIRKQNKMYFNFCDFRHALLNFTEIAGLKFAMHLFLSYKICVMFEIV